MAGERVKGHVSIEQIMDATRVASGASDVWSSRRQKHLVMWRALAWHIAVSHGFSRAVIGECCGRDHSTVIYGAAKARRYLTVDLVWQQSFDRLLAEIGRTPTRRGRLVALAQAENDRLQRRRLLESEVMQQAA